MTLNERLIALEEEVKGVIKSANKRHRRFKLPAELLGVERDAADLSADLLTIGLIGGTGVGKSTLMNALAGSEVSAASVRRPTTDRIVPYVHADRLADLRRMKSIVPHLTEVIRPHTEDRIRSLLVFDLPDMDSFAAENAEIVRKSLPNLDVIVIVTSLTKYNDRALHEWLRVNLVGVNLDNCCFVLNKVDEIDHDDGPDAAQKLQQRFADLVARTLRDAGFSAGKPRFYLISALKPRENIPGNVFLRLEADLFRERESRERTRVKTSNRLSLLSWKVQKVRASLNLAERGRWIESEINFVREKIRDICVLTEVRESFERALLRGPAFAEISRRFYQAEADRWPLLPRLDFLLSPIRQLDRVLRLLVRYFSDRGEFVETGPLDDVRRRLTELQWERRRRRAAEIQELFEEDQTLRDTRIIDTWIIGAERELEEATKRALTGLESTRVPMVNKGGYRRLLVFGPLIWFPLMQPLLQELLDPNSPATLPLRLLHRLIRISGASHLLTAGLFVVGTWFVLLLVLKTRSRRRVQELCRGFLNDETAAAGLEKRLREFLSSELTQQFTLIDREQEHLKDLERRISILATELG